MAERAERGEAVTARDGSFLIGGLAGGRYLVEVSWNGAPLVLETAPADILVEDGRRASVGLVARRPAPAAAPSDAGAGLQPGAIAGTLQGFSTTPDVVAVRAGAAPVRARADRARFELARLQPGSYLVSATALGAGAFARVEVRPGETAQVALSSGAAGPLEGRVTELRTRDPVAGLRCRVAPRTGDSAAPLPYPGEVWTDAQGRYRFAAVPPGARYTMCSGAGYSDAVGDGDLVVVRQLGKLGLLGFKPDWSRIFRLEVAYIRPGQPAERAGLEVGDVVTAVDGIDVSGLGEAAVELLLRDRLPGSVARITVQRGGQARELTLTVGQWQ